MDQERLTVFKAEIQAQLKEIDSIYTRLEARSRQRGEAAVESLGYQLHNLYCAFEDLFKIIAAEFENHIEDKSRYHAELFKRMTMIIEGVRPPSLLKKCTDYWTIFARSGTFSGMRILMSWTSGR